MPLVIIRRGELVTKAAARKRGRWNGEARDPGLK